MANGRVSQMYLRAIKRNRSGSRKVSVKGIGWSRYCPNSFASAAAVDRAMVITPLSVPIFVDSILYNKKYQISPVASR